MRKQYIIISSLILLALTIITCPRAEAACTGGAGSICILLRDQLGGAIIGDPNTKVTVVTEGADNNIHANPNVTWNDITDGGPLDEDGSADGDIEIAASSLAGNINPAGTDDFYVQVVSTSGYVNANVPVASYNEYNSGTDNQTTESLNFTVKINVKNQAPFASTLTTGYVSVSNSNNCNGAYFDGTVGQDQDGSADGAIYVKCPANEIADSVTLTVSAPGYVDFVDAAQAVSNGAQVAATSTNQFTLYIPSGSIQDSLGNGIVPSDANPSVYFASSTTTVHGEAANGGNVYIAAEGAGTLEIHYPGYIKKAMAVNPSASLQSGIAYTGANALSFQVVASAGASSLENELGSALAFNGTESFIVCTNNASWSACSASAVPATARYSAPGWYIAPSAAPGAYYIGIYKIGYIRQVDAGSISTSWNSSTGPAFDGPAADGLKFGIKAILRNELGVNINPAAMSTLTYAGAAYNASNGVNTAYFANTTGISQPLSIGEAGYINATGTNPGLVSFSATNTAQTVFDFNSGYATLTAVVPGATNNAFGIQYKMKVLAGAGRFETQFGAPLSFAGSETITVCTASNCGTTDGTVTSTLNGGTYYLTSTAADGNRWVRIQRTGYIRTTDFTPINVTADAQVSPAFTVSGGDAMLFTAVSAVKDQTATPLTSVTLTTGTGYAVTCVESATNTGYYGCAVPNGQVTAVSGAKTGYVTDLKATAGNANETGAQLVNDLTGANNVLFQIRVYSAANIFEDELGTAIIPAATDTITVCTAGDCSSTEAPLYATYTANTWYIAPATTGNKWIKVQRGGFVTQIDGASINANTAAQVNPAFDNATLDGLKYQIKVAAGIGFLESEIGTAVTLAGGVNETITVCTDASCTGSEAMLSSTYNGGSWYLAPSATGIKYIRMAKTGFITRIDTHSISVSAATQVSPNFVGATDGLKYPIKVSGGAGKLENEFGAGMSFTGAGEILTVCTVANCTTTEAPVFGPTYSGGSYYIAPATFGTKWIRLQKTGYVRVIDAGSIAANNTAQASPSFSVSGGDPMPYTLKTIVRDQVGTGLTAVALTSGTANGTICEENATNTSLYGCAVPNGQTTAVQGIRTGFVTMSKATAGPANETGAPLVNDLTGANGLLYQIRVVAGANLLDDELGTGLTPAATDTVTVCTTSDCSVTETPLFATFSANIWYVAPPVPGLKWIKVAKGGFVTQIDGASIIASTAAQVNPAFDNATLDGLKYQLKVIAGAGNLESEIGTALALAGGVAETITVCTDAACAGSEAPISSTYNGGAWYIAPSAVGTKYVRMAKNGFVTRIDSHSVSIGATAQVSPNYAGATDGLIYPIKVSGGVGRLESEYGSAVTLTGAGETITVCTVANCTTTEAPTFGPTYNGGSYYIGPATYGVKWIRVQRAGYVRVIDTSSITAANTGQVSPALTLAGGDPMLFTAVSLVQDQLAQGLSGVTLTSGTANGTTCEQNATNTALYGCAVPNGQTTAMQGVKTGYITMIKATAGPANETGAQLANNLTVGSAMSYQIKVMAGANLYDDELGTALTPAATDTITVCTNSNCTLTEAPSYATFTANTWYIAPATTGAKWMRVAKGGFVTQIDGASIAASAAGPQVNPAFDNATADGMKYQVKVIGGAGNVESELGAAIALVGTESFDLCNTSTCAATDTGMTSVFNGGAWYLKPGATGTRYVRITTTNYAKTTDSTSITVGPNAQVSPGFISSTDGLRYPLKVVIATQLGRAVKNNTGATLALPGGYSALTFNGSAPSFTVGSDTAYWAVSANNAILNIGAAGYVSAQNTNTGFANVTTSTASQTLIVLGATGTVRATPVTAGESITVKGLEYSLKTSLADQFGAGAAPASMGPLTFNGHAPVENDPVSTTTVYFADSGSAAALVLHKTGYVNSENTNAGLASFTPITTAQTSISLGNFAAAPAIVAGTPNNVKGLEPTLKVVAHDEYGATLATATVAVTAGQTVTDGLAGDLDGAADGVIYVTQDPSAGNPETITVSRDGYVNHVEAATNLVATVQSTVTSANQFNVRATMQDETAAPVTGLTAAANFKFTDAASSTVITPYDFHEAGAGVYKFAVGTALNPGELLSAVYNSDADPYTELSAAPVACTPATGAGPTTNCGTITMYKIADYVAVTPATASIQAGDIATFTIEMKDNDGNAITAGPDASAAVTVTLAGGSASPASAKDITATTCANAPAVGGSSDTSVQCVLTNGAAVITVTDTVVGDGADIVVSTAKNPLPDFPRYSHANETFTLDVAPGAAASLAVSGINDPSTAGATATVAITALDAFGNVATGYAGTADVTSSDASATLPPAINFTGLNGTATASVNLFTVGEQTVTATDNSNPLLTGQQTAITVQPGPAVTLTVTGISDPATAGATATVTITALDALGNVATGYAGTADVTSSDGAAVLPPAIDFTGRNGVATASVKLFTVGEQTVTATDNSSPLLTGQQTAITVQPGSVIALTVTGISDPVTAGATSTMTISARDILGNIVTGYAGTVVVTSSDAAASLPPAIDFTGRNGTATASVTLITAGEKTVTATDNSNPALTGQQTAITVQPAAAVSLTISGISDPMTSGATATVTIRAFDAFGNDAAGYAGSVNVTSSDAAAALPAAINFTGRNGVATASVTLITVGEQTVTATDNSNPLLTAQQAAITVQPGAASVLSVTGIGDPVAAGVSTIATIRALDARGNVATGYAGAVNVTSSDAAAALPPAINFAGRNGTATASITFFTTGEQTVTATDNSNPLITGQQSAITVQSGQLLTLSITAPASGTVVSGTVAVNGTVSGPRLSAWTLSYGPGTSPALWKIIQTGTGAVSAGSLASWNTSGLLGTYTLRLFATDTVGSAATATVVITVSNTTSVTGTIQSGRWVLVSLPVNPTPPDPISMYGLGNEYKVYRWNPEKTPVPRLGQYEYPASLSAGNGYWVFAFNQDMPYTINGALTDTSQNYIIPIKTGWNQIGTPYNRDYPWAQVQVRDGAIVYDLTTAAGMGLISSTLTSYDNTAHSWVQNDISTVMTPQKGFEVRAYKNLDLIFTPGTGQPGGLARVVRSPYDYKVKISAKTGDVADVDNYFGAAGSAAAEFDGSDLEEPNRDPGDSYVSLYFPRETWRQAGRYANDMRPAADQSDDWTFNVETNQAGKTVTLTWDSKSLPTDRYTFTLVNLDSGERVDMASCDSYTFTAPAGDAATSHFKIEVARKSGGQGTVTFTLTPGWNLVSAPIDPEVTSALVQLGDNLPLLDVFQYYNGKFYPAEKADIQAGLGYWIFVDKSTEIDIQGLPSASTVDVPIKSGWNSIGDPFETSLPWADNVVFTCGGTQYTLSQAVSAGVTNGKLYEYTGDGYNAASELKPWHGYFLKASQDCNLILTRQ